ncbi:hypothetical protein J3R82DRAFT_9588 [Butyriboletus roseoflavus]|nr:hypothetical protein J3R82DRAFT_9588 [Butyriboletus roseoflavus]
MTPVGYIHEDQYCAVCNGSRNLSPAGFHKEQAACRYYQAGDCRRGSSCPFAHSSVADQTNTPTLPHPAYQAEHMFASHPLGQTPVYPPPGPQTHPVFLWQPYLPPSRPFDPRYRPAPQTEAVSDYPDDKSDPSSAESSSTATSMDYQLRMVLDTARLEGAELRVVRSIASPSGDFGINSSPGYGDYRYPVFPVKATYVVGRGRTTSGQCLDQGSMVTLPSPFSLSRQDDMKKPLAYKTKPCKFYTANGKCSNGEKCTFIHDPESIGRANKSPTELTPPMDATLPPKPLSRYEECRTKDFYPIAWRVIGGGVMMGGQRQICPAFATTGHCNYGNDCKLAHETELQTDQVGFIEPKNETLGNAEGLLHQPVKGTTPKRLQGRKFIKVPSPEAQQRENFPSTTPHPHRPNVPALEVKKDNEVVVPPARDAPTSPVHRRTQSMSMVLTPPSPVETTHANDYTRCQESHVAFSICHAIQVVSLPLFSVVSGVPLLLRSTQGHLFDQWATALWFVYPTLVHALPAFRVQKHDGLVAQSHPTVPFPPKMKDPFPVDASHPIATLLCLASPETYDAAQGLNYLHDGHARNANGEYLILFITLWHVCSLLQPDFFFKFRHVTAVVTATSATGPTSLLTLRQTSDGGLPGSRRAPPDLVQMRLFDFEVPALGRLAAAWPSHPIHVSALTSPDGDQLEAQVWLCDRDSIRRRMGPLEDPDAARTLAHAYAGYVQDAGGDGNIGERVLAWLAVDAYDGPLSDVPLAGGWSNVGCENGSESTLVTVRMDRAMADSAPLEGFWYGHGHSHGPGVASNLDGLDTLSSDQAQARAQEGRTCLQHNAAVQAQDPHEAHGVSMIIKALVQQNAGAALFLRTTMACVAALLCLAHSIFVLGDRPSFVRRRQS